MRKFLYIFAFIFTSLTAHAQDASNRYVEHSVMATGKWVKISVDKAGVYQLTNSTLRSMGFSNPDNVRLYGLNREMLPESGLEYLDGDLTELPLYRTTDKVLFYGRGLTKWVLNSADDSKAQFSHANNPYSLHTYYLLAETADVTPREFEKFAYTTADDAPLLTTFPEHALLEKDEFSYMNSGRTFFYAHDFANGNRQDYALNLPGIAKQSDVYLTVQFAANGNSTSSLSVSFNDSLLGSISFTTPGMYDAARLNSASYTISRQRSNQQNTIQLLHTRASGTTGHLDYIRAGYLRQLHLSGNELLFRPTRSGNVRFQLTGGKSETVLWHINNNDSYEEVAGTYDTATATWTFPFCSDNSSANAWKDEELLALNPSATFPTPTIVGSVPNQDLHALTDIDLVIIVPSSGKLTKQAQQLADAHTQQDGMRCIVVPVNQIYNEFSAGTPDATAIRRFAKMLYEKTGDEHRPLRNLLLFGSGMWDNRMITPNLSKKSPSDYLLCYESDNSLSHTNSYVLEDYFALLDDDAPTDVLRAKPRIGVGRIPVTTAADAKNVVNKLIRYINNEEVGPWKNTLTILCDDGNNNTHMKDGDSVIAHTARLYPDFRIKRIYWDTYERQVSTTGKSYPAAIADINKQMQDGSLIMNYTGHGANYCLSHEQVIHKKNFANWSSPRLPLWITAACDVTPFDMNEEHLGEVALLNPQGAAMGFIGTSRTVYSSPNLALNWRFMEYVLDVKDDGNRYTIGEALSAAKCNYIDRLSGITNDVNKAHFILLGDPAITLATPTYKVEIDRINDMYAPGTPENVAAGSVVTIEGRIVDENGNLATDFNGTVSPVVMDNIEEVICLNNAKGEGTSAGGNDSNNPAHTFSDRMRLLYTCSDYIADGKFRVSFPIPLDNNYSGETGLISLYANNVEHTLEANGSFTNFLVNGTATNISNDHTGPDIQFYLNTENFVAGSTVNETPLLVATLTDENGINITGSGIGHDVTAIIDNDASTTYSLNSYFTPTVGNYQSGTLAFSIPTLTDGRHTLTLRAYDTLNNPSSISTYFYVNNGLRPQVFNLIVSSPVRNEATFTIVTDRPQSNVSMTLHVYDVTGREVWKASESNFSTTGTYTFTWNLNEANAHLPAGVYIANAIITASGSAPTTVAKKFIVASPR